MKDEDTSYRRNRVYRILCSEALAGTGRVQCVGVLPLEPGVTFGVCQFKQCVWVEWESSVFRKG